MKKLFTFPVIVLASLSLFAQTPDKMSYQAVIRNASNALVINTKIRMEINILKGSPSGTVVYTETHNPTTNANGLVSIEIGGGAGFDMIDWSAGPYFIETRTDPTGGTNYIITGTSQLLSVPYALHAKTAESVTGTITEIDPVFNAWDKDYNDLTNKPTAISDLTMNANAQNITNLANPINAQDAATKAYVDELLIRIDAFEEYIILKDGFTDTRDSNHYKAVKIGDQIWMAENLKYLPSVVPPGTGSQTEPCYYVYAYSDSVVDDAKATINYTTYGVLYNWPAAMAGSESSSANPSGVQGVCPTGWHLPSDAEWTQLIDYLGGADIAGGQLKEAGTEHWESPNTDATNKTGFTALPGGCRFYGGYFIDNGREGRWWCATESDATKAFNKYTYYRTSKASTYYVDKAFGYSVRCVKD